MFSILHISDLHRSVIEPVDNDTLIATLLADCDRYALETPKIPLPDAVIVSGDIIQGARIGDTHWRTTMKDQYRVATQFLEQVCVRMLKGERNRLIMVPGNHDVCWNTALASMEKVELKDYPKNLKSALSAQDSLFRWSWNELSLYKIVDQEMYDSRLSFYWDFVESFYAGANLPVSIDRKRGYQLFELDKQQIVVAAFDSVAGNDCFNYSGAFPRGVVSRCNLNLRDSSKKYALMIGVWHHNIQGPPLRDDYMDVSQIQEMAAAKFQLGFHGHQHVASVNTHYIHLGESQAMAVVSAGSLCAGAKELPRGVNRQYNIVVINEKRDGANVYAREMSDGGHFSRKSNGVFSEGYVSLKWDIPKDTMGRPVNIDLAEEQAAVLRAENALHNNKPQESLDILLKTSLLPGSHARKIALRAAMNLSNWLSVIKILDQPSGIEENLMFIQALIKIGNFDKAQQSLDECLLIDNQTRSRIQEEISIMKIIKGTR